MSEFTAAAAAIAARMHRDTLEILRPTKTDGPEGGTIKGTPVSQGTHKGNVRPYSAELAQMDYGLVITASVRIFALPDARLKMGRLITWGSGLYKITGLPPTGAMAVILADKV